MLDVVAVVLYGSEDLVLDSPPAPSGANQFLHIGIFDDDVGHPAVMVSLFAFIAEAVGDIIDGGGILVAV